MKPRRVAIFDETTNLHRRFSIDTSVPEDVAAELKLAVRNGTKIRDLNEAVRSFEITS